MPTLSPPPPVPLDVPPPTPALQGMEEERMQVGEKGAREGPGDWEQGHRDMRMEARGSRHHPTMKDAQSSGAVHATEVKAND